MIDSEKIAFRDLMVGVMEVYQKPISKDAMSIWWAALTGLTFDQVRAAMQAHMTGDRGTFMPLPADILSHCRKGSGHLPPDEAWSLALTSMDDNESIIWTTQISEAWGAAWPCMEIGDKYGARLAFLSAYERLVKDGAPVWRVSLGYSHEGRERAVDEALKRGLITAEKAKDLLPYDCAKIPSVSGLLPAPEQTPEQKANVASMLAMLKTKFEVSE